MASQIRIQRICQHCGNEFTAKTTVTKYCGDVCSKRAYKARKKAGKIEASNEETKAILEKPLTHIQGKDFLSISEVCQLFKVSRTTVWRLMKEGKVQAAKIGRKKFITRSSIDALFQPELIQPKATEEQAKELNIDDCWNMGEIQKIFGIHDKTLYSIIKRFDIPKMQKGKFVYVPKERIIEILGEPKQS